MKIEELEQYKKPCYYKPSGIKNGSYTRVGDRDDKLTDYELYSLQSYRGHIFEDIRPNKRATLADLDIEKLKKYIDSIKEYKPKFAKNDFNKCLKICGIIDTNEDESYPTLAGIMTFGEYPQTFYPQLFVACAVVLGVKIGDKGQFGERFLDNKRIEGTIEEMLNGTMTFLARNMKNRVIIDETGKREDRTEYPLDALREAVANALVHRDYSIQTETAYISVNMYSDRIEIINPGNLYGINRLENISSSSNMEVRNPTIVRILEESGSIIENRHSGIPTMKREMKKYGLREPEFYDERDSFKVVFRNEIVGTNNQEQEDEPANIDELTKKVLEFCVIPRSAKEIEEHLGGYPKRNLIKNIIKPLINIEKIEYTNKSRINAKNQKYKTICSPKCEPKE